MGQGNEKGAKPWIRRWLNWRVGVVLLCILFMCALMPVDTRGRITDVPLLRLLSMAKQVYVATVTASLDYASTGIDRRVFPADMGITSNLEYVRYLVRSRIISESDLHLFCKRDRNARSLDSLQSEDIVFRFANVSVNDPPETIFCVSYNVLEVKPPHKWWEFLKRGNFPYPFNKAYIVMRLNGDGGFNFKMPPDPKNIAPLPPREPKFLDP